MNEGRGVWCERVSRTYVCSIVRFVMIFRLLAWKRYHGTHSCHGHWPQNPILRETTVLVSLVCWTRWSRKCKVSRGARKYLRAPKGGKEGKRKGKRKEKGREGRRLLRLTSHIIIPYQLHKYITSTGCWSCCCSTDGSVSVCSNTVGQLCCLLLFFQKVSSQRYWDREIRWPVQSVYSMRHFQCKSYERGKQQ